MVGGRDKLSFSVSRDAVLVAFPLFPSSRTLFASISKARDSLSFREIDSLLENPQFFTFSCAFICERAYLQEYPRPYALFSLSPTCDFSRPPPRRYHDLPRSTFFVTTSKGSRALRTRKKTSDRHEKGLEIDTGREKNKEREREGESHDIDTGI